MMVEQGKLCFGVGPTDWRATSSSPPYLVLNCITTSSKLLVVHLRQNCFAVLSNTHPLLPLTHRYRQSGAV